ncbi:THAP domain-containing protein 8 [Rhineura floridana]|uniref:THAP domain-containing protein 8 n=1 Tax=Rhineura floridana TaxID=261503 RepID=UPI002AC84A0C|nr:THAP domain-containing protein 8 [Rhineura floridana]
MTKYCRAPNCSNSAGQPRPDNQRLSFYKFPLHNPERLQQWLSQMNQEKWVPTKHQHLCSEHFAPSCFEYRWGVRYLKPDAIPTIFQTPDGSLKRENPARTPSDVPGKKLILECHREKSMPEPRAINHPEPSTLETLAIAIDPSVAAAPIYVETQSSASDLDFHTLSGSLVGAVNLVPLVQIVEPLKAVTLTVASPVEAVPGQPLPDPVDQQVVDFLASLPPSALEAMPSSSVGASKPFCAEVAVPCEVVAAAANQPPLQALVGDQPLAAEQGALIIENVSIEPFLEANPAAAAAVLSSLQESSTEMVAYFETIPTAPIAAAPSSGVTPPETVLSSALSLPIVSTVPIVSNQASPEASPTEEVKPEELSSAESLVEELEEHCYHKYEGTTSELVEVVMSLQKKVKVLQQRHRRHCAKLEAMEGVVEQLRKENLVSEEKLKLLEMACLQSSTIVPESGGAVAIICQDSDQALVYAVPQLPEEGNETIIHVEEQ